MAITTISDVVAKMRPTVYANKAGVANQGGTFRITNAWYSGGHPPAATANTSGLSGQAVTGNVAALPFTNSVSPTYLVRVSRPSALTSGPLSGNPGMFQIVDRLWENSGLDRTSTTAQTVNSVTWPARDSDGATNGECVFLAIEVSTATGTGTPTVTVSYTNSAGTSGRTGTNIVSSWASSAAGAWIPIGLAAGDTGVRSVQSVTFSATWGNSGVLHLVAYRPICILSSTRTALNTFQEDALTLGMPRLWNDSQLMYLFYPSTTGPNNSGAMNVTYAQG